jgi:DNA-binding NarL/FixJ family response regulator
VTTAPAFSRRELEIIALVGERKSDRQIAVTLGIRLPTVSAHLTNIAEKLNLTADGIPRREGIRQWLAMQQPSSEFHDGARGV